MLLNVIVILLPGLSGGTVEKSKDVPLPRHDKLSPMNIIRQKKVGITKNNDYL